MHLKASHPIVLHRTRAAASTGVILMAKIKPFCDLRGARGNCQSILAMDRQGIPKRLTRSEN
ncbi:hypothetical protein RSAG8_05436, partial [Rhizoctonia solani AG-8 WAC10335]